MAENVPWWLEFLGESKLVIWAHNAHIARGLTVGDYWITMGEFLVEEYGNDSLPIGFFSAEGTFTSYAFGGPAATTAPPWSLTAMRPPFRPSASRAASRARSHRAPHSCESGRVLVLVDCDGRVVGRTRKGNAGRTSRVLLSRERDATGCQETRCAPIVPEDVDESPQLESSLRGFHSQ